MMSRMRLVRTALALGTARAGTCVGTRGAFSVADIAVFMTVLNLGMFVGYNPRNTGVHVLMTVDESDYVEEDGSDGVLSSNRTSEQFRTRGRRCGRPGARRPW